MGDYEYWDALNQILRRWKAPGNLIPVYQAQNDLGGLLDTISKTINLRSTNDAETGTVFSKTGTTWRQQLYVRFCG